MSLIAIVLLAFPISGYGPVCTYIEDRDGDGRVELVMTSSWSGLQKGELLIWSSKSHTILERIRPPGASLGFAADVLRVDPEVSTDRLLVSDLWNRTESARGEGVIYRLDKSLKVHGTIETEPGESIFGSRLATSEVHDGEQLLAAQMRILDDPSEKYSGREWFAVYSLREHRRKGIIKGSSQFDGTRNASVVCTWTPDCNDDKVPDLAIDMRDRVVLYSGKDLLPVQVLTYAEHVNDAHYFGRSLTLIHTPKGSDALVLGLPSWFFQPEACLMLWWDLPGEGKHELIPNPGSGTGFGASLCQMRNGDCFAGGIGAFDGALYFAHHVEPTRFSPILTESDERIMVGSAVRGVGDLDGDEVDDVAVTRFNPEAAGWPGQGVVLVSGKKRTTIGRIELDDKHQYVWR